jgi:hypothetical protein
MAGGTFPKNETALVVSVGLLCCCFLFVFYLAFSGLLLAASSALLFSVFLCVFLFAQLLLLDISYTSKSSGL